MKRCLAVLLCVLCVVASPLATFAHSGGTDSKGGHYDHSTGEYHYHHGEHAHAHWGDFCTLLIWPIVTGVLILVALLFPVALVLIDKAKAFLDKRKARRTARHVKTSESESVSRNFKSQWSAAIVLIALFIIIWFIPRSVAMKTQIAYYVYSVAEHYFVTIALVVLACAVLPLICIWFNKNRRIKQLEHDMQKLKKDSESEARKLKDEMARQNKVFENSLRAAKESGYTEASKEAQKKLESEVSTRVRAEKRAFFSSLYWGKNMRDLVKVPRNTIIGDDGLPCNPNSEHWGPDYTVYITNNGQCYHKKSCHSLITSRAKPIHIYNAPELRDPCSICCSKSKEMNLEWFESYKSIMSIVKEYGIKIENPRLLSRRSAAIASLSNSQLKFSMRDPETNPTPPTTPQG